MPTQPSAQGTFSQIEGNPTGWNVPSENDSDAGDDYNGDVTGLDCQWDMLNRGLWDFEAMTVAIRQRYLTEVCKLPPQAAPANLEDLPWRAAPKQRTDGDQTEFYEYIPLWTDPEFETDRKSGPRYFQGSLLNRLYPAQTEESLAKNPTEMAKRYGIHPDRTDGRSRLSPEGSVSRRYQLKNGNWVDTGDLDRFLEEHYFLSEAAQASQQSIETYIEDQSQRTATTDEEEEEEATLEMWQLCRKHNAELKKDADYQRFVFNGYTTDEVGFYTFDGATLKTELPKDPRLTFIFYQLQKLGVLDFSNDVYFDLQGPLHPILTRDRWLPAPADAGTKDFPRQYYAIRGENQIHHTGLWTAQDPLIWDALQPALQLLTRILNSNLPAWTGLLDLYTRLQVDLDRDPLADSFRNEAKRGSPCTCRNAWHTEAHPFSTKNFPELLKLCESGFDSSAWTRELVTKSLRFKIESCNRFADEDDPDALRATFGFTCMRASGDRLYTTVSIGAELIWPLLSIHTSNAEKRTCSFAFAAILLHEIAHAIVMAQSSAVVHQPSLDCVADPKQKDLLKRACCRLFSPLVDEPFFEDEPTAEAGFALENQVFGGVLTYALRSSSDLQPVPVQLIMTQLNSKAWPFSRLLAWVKPTKNTKQLLSPPQRMLDMKRAVPSDTIARVFSQSFWDKDFARYGPETLKVQGGRVLKKPPLTAPIVGSHWYVYGPNRGFFLKKACYVLKTSGYNTIACYLESRARQRGMGLATRRLWHYEHRTWPDMSKDLDQAAKEVREAATKYLPLFEDAVTPAAERRVLFANRHQVTPGTDPSVGLEAWIQDAEQSRSHSFGVLLGRLMKLHRLLTARFEYTQSMLCTLTTLESADREKIRRKHFGRLVNVHHRVPFRLASKLAIAVRSLAQLYRLRTRRLPQEPGTQPGDSALQIKLQEDVGDLRRQERLFRTLEGMFRNHLGPPTSGEYSGQFWGPERFIAVTSLNPATEPEVFFEAACSDLKRVKDPDVIRIVDEVFKILKAFEGSEERAPSPASSLASTAPPPSPSGGSGAGPVSATQPQPGEPSAGESTTESRKRSWRQTEGGTDASGNETDLPPAKRVHLLDKDSDAPYIRDAESCARNRKAFEASDRATIDQGDPPTNFNTSQPAPSGMIAFPDPKTGFVQFAPQSRAAEVGPMLQQAAQERETSAAQARQALVDLEARDRDRQRIQGPLTAGERAALSNLQHRETDFDAFKLKERVIRAFEAIWDGLGGQDEDVEMQL